MIGYIKGGRGYLGGVSKVCEVKSFIVFKRRLDRVLKVNNFLFCFCFFDGIYLLKVMIFVII